MGMRIGQAVFLFSVWMAASHGWAAEWVERAGFRTRAAAPGQPGKVGFTIMLPAQTRIVFTNLLSDAVAAQNQIRLNGSGTALGDVDGDGLCDVYFCGLEGPNALYRNLGGWRFEDMTKSAGLEVPYQFATGCALADVDGDGDLDLLVNCLGSGTRLFRNDGKGRFTDDPNAGLLRRYGAMSMALADIEGDGDLDLYVCNYRASTIRSTGFALAVENGRRSILPQDREDLEMTADGRVLENGEPDALYINDGRGIFKMASWTDGTFLNEEGRPLAKAPRDWGQCVMMRDVNGDGAPDIYVCNDFQTPDRFWINDGRGKFRALPATALRNTSTFSMGVDFADINRDGHDDFITLDMLERSHARRMRQANGKEPAANYDIQAQFDRNTLQLNRRDNTFAEIAYYSGIEATGWSWSPIFLDVDLDGYEDLLITTGHLFDMQDLDAEALIQSKGPFRPDQIPGKLLLYPRMESRNVALRNLGDLRFADAGAAWGYDAPGISHGMALADLDEDGDLDVVINRLNDHALLLRNDSPAPRISVRAKTGAKIRVRGGPVAQSQQIISGGRYLSSDDSVRTFAAGPLNEVQIDWRSGAQTVLTNIPANTIIEATEATNVLRISTQRNSHKKWFAGVATNLPPHRPSNAFALQPLMPWESSARHVPGRYPEALPFNFPNVADPISAGLVTGFAFADQDGDGDPDLFVATEWGPIRFFRNDQGKFVEATEERGLTALKGFWQALALGDFNNDRRIDIVAGNWGLNTKYRASPEHPLRLYYRDFDSNGSVELIETHWDATSRQEVPERDFATLAASLPFLREKFATFKAFAEAPARAIIGEGVRSYEATYLESAVFLNTGSKFEAAPLPLEAQFSPVFGIAAADFNGDGNLDLFLSQNTFTVAPHTTRSDSGRGLLLEGNGQGRFRVVPAEESGIELYGEGRACRAADLNRDGRMDLEVTMRSGTVWTFYNIR